MVKRELPGTPRSAEKVRARIVEHLEEIRDVQDLEFVELAASLVEAPFDGEAALEALLSVADYISAARVRHELAVEELARARTRGDEPS